MDAARLQIQANIAGGNTVSKSRAIRRCLLVAGLGCAELNSELGWCWRHHRWGQCPVWLVVVGWTLGRDGRLGLPLVDVSPWYSRWPAEQCIAPAGPRQPHANRRSPRMPDCPNDVVADDEVDERRHFRAIRETRNSACAEVGLGTVGTGRAARPRRERTGSQPWALTANAQPFSIIPAGEPVPEDFWAG